MSRPKGFTPLGKLLPCKNLANVLILATSYPMKSLKNLVLRLKNPSVLSKVRVGLGRVSSA